MESSNFNEGTDIECVNDDFEHVEEEFDVVGSNDVNNEVQFDDDMNDGNELSMDNACLLDNSGVQQKRKRTVLKRSFAHLFFEALSDNTFKCRFTTGISHTATMMQHPSKICGPVTNLLSHLHTWHTSEFSFAESAAAEGAAMHPIADKLVTKAADKVAQSGIHRFCTHVGKRPGRARKELLLVLWLVDSAVPFNAINSPHFRRWLEEIGVELSSSRTLSDVALPAAHSTVLELQRSEFSKVESAAIVCNGSKKGEHSIIAIVAHYINSDWELSNAMLGAVPNPTEQSGPQIAAVVNSHVSEMLGENTLVSACVTDNGANYGRAAAMLCNDTWKCSAHTLQLAIRDVTEKQDVYQVAIDLALMQVCNDCGLIILVLTVSSLMNV